MDGRLPVEEEVIRQPFPHGSLLMLFYPVARPDVTPSGAEDAGLSLLGQAVMVAVREADRASPAGPGLGPDGPSPLPMPQLPAHPPAASPLLPHPTAPSPPQQT